MAEEEKSRRGQALILLVLLSSALFLFGYGLEVRNAEEIPLRSLDLPETIGVWHGREAVFCQNRDCQASFTVDTLENREVCPTCTTGTLGPAPVLMVDVLPDDTVIRKMDYTAPGERKMMLSLVLSSKRGGIHRPQLCLPLQGYEIAGSRLLSVALRPGENVKTMVLDLNQRGVTAEGQAYARRSFFAYWFASPSFETPYDFAMVLRMAFDRVFLNTTHKWAYLTVAGDILSENDRYDGDLVQFIQLAYPVLMKRARLPSKTEGTITGDRKTLMATPTSVASRISSPIFMEQDKSGRPSPALALAQLNTNLQRRTNFAARAASPPADTNAPATAAPRKIPWDTIAFFGSPVVLYLLYRWVVRKRSRY